MEIDTSRVIVRDIEKEMRKSYLDYSMSVIVGRALPDIRDGLKPVHRRILYTMHENSLSPDKPYRKAADTVGSVLGRYHPHGDASVYDALVRMAQDFSLRYPLIDGHGNFGSIDGDPAAAYRYTEARMSKMAMEMLTDINKETVAFMPNYDDRLNEPVVIPSRFPNLLVNGSTGIAVGMATNIPPHNLNEVIDALSLLIDNPDCTLEDLMQHIKGPDFPTGGIIMGHSGIRAAYATGRGKITLRARADIQEVKGRQRIVITEIPYMVNKSRLLVAIADLVKDKRIDGITALRDESDRNGMSIVIELRRDANAQIVLNQLYSYTQLQDTVGVIQLAVVNGEPKILTLKEMLEEYLDFQVEVITKRTQFDLRKAQERSHILEGFVIALDFIDEVIEILRSSKNIPDGKARLIERFELSTVQADAIVAMRFGQLTGMERTKIEDELAGLLEKIREYEAILADGDKILAIIDEELGEIKDRFGDDRRTSIEAVSGEVDIEDLIPVEDCVITYTNIGYIKRQPVDAYKLQRRGGRGVSGMKQRDEDVVEEMFISSTHDNVLFITNRGIMYKLKCYEIPTGSRQARGTNIVNLLPLQDGEKIAAMIKTTDFDEDKFIVMVTKRGTIKRTRLSAYKNVRKNGIIAIRFDEENPDEIAGVKMTDGDSEIIVATKLGAAIRFKEKDLRPLGRNTYGVRAIRLRGDDEVVALERINDDDVLLTVTDKGFGRRTQASRYRLQKRGGYGTVNYKVSEERGNVCGVKVVSEEDDVILISSDGIVIRIRVSDISIMSRYALGVRVMRVLDDVQLVALTIAEHDDSADIDEVEQIEGEEEISEDEVDEFDKLDEENPPEDDDEIIEEDEDDDEEDDMQE